MDIEDVTSRNLEFVCRKCGQVISSKEKGQFCPNPDCGTMLEPRPLPKYWLFQFNPKMYLWFERIGKTNEPEQWLTSQHSKYIHKDDLVAVWASGKKAGVYALGRIFSNPSQAPLKADQKEFWIDKDSLVKFEEYKSVLVKYIAIMSERPILEDECQNDRDLCSLAVFFNPQGTNFPLSYVQWLRIVELLKVR